MKTVCLALFLSLLSSVLSSAALAQNARVVRQNQSGLNYPSTTQIGDGTMSPTARGYYGRASSLPVAPLGPSVIPGDSVRSDLGRPGIDSRQARVPNLGLPSTPLGPHVRAGDVSRTDLQGGSGVSSPSSALPAAPLGPHMRAGDIDRSDLHPEAFKSNQLFWHPELRNRRQQSPSEAVQQSPSTPASTYDSGKPGIHF